MSGTTENWSHCKTLNIISLVELLMTLFLSFSFRYNPSNFVYLDVINVSKLATFMTTVCYQKKVMFSLREVVSPTYYIGWPKKYGSVLLFNNFFILTFLVVLKLCVLEENSMTTGNFQTRTLRRKKVKQNWPVFLATLCKVF